MSYLIKKDNKTNSITYINYNLEGYKFTPKSKNNAKIKINQLMIVNPTMIDKILTIKFNDMFKKIMNYLALFLNSDDDNNGEMILGEIDRLKSILINKYHNYLAVEKQKLFLDKLNFLENQLKMKIIINNNINYDSSYEFEETVSQGRGR